MSRRRPTPAGAAAPADQPVTPVSTPAADPAIGAAPAKDAPAAPAASDQAEPAQGTPAAPEPAGSAPDEGQPAAAPAPEPAPASEPEPASDQAPAEDGADEGDTFARVLVAFEDHAPNAVITLPIALGRSLQSQGVVDCHPDAVAYAQGLTR